MLNPLEQFEIHPIFNVMIGNFDLSFTNSSLWMIVAVVVAVTFFLYAIRKNLLEPNFLQLIAEIIYAIPKNIMAESMSKKGDKFFPFIFSLYIFVMMGNLIGLIPWSFTYTSHIVITFAIALFIFLLSTVLGFIINGKKYFSIFLPSGAPLWSVVLLVPVEVISYLSRPVSLSLRLFANMLVGHFFLELTASSIVLLGFFGVLPLIFMFPLFILELIVAVIQAYVFTMLSCFYLNDALDFRH